MAKILIVDDDATVAEVVGLVLGAAGYEICKAHSVAAAKEILAQEHIDGAIIDVWLNNHDGLDLAALLAQREERFPFVIMSGGGPGRSLENVTARADSLGAASVLFKPFDDDELLDAVAAMLSGKTA